MFYAAVERACIVRFKKILNIWLKFLKIEPEGHLSEREVLQKDVRLSASFDFGIVSQNSEGFLFSNPFLVCEGKKRTRDKANKAPSRQQHNFLIIRAKHVQKILPAL